MTPQLTLVSIALGAGLAGACQQRTTDAAETTATAPAAAQAEAGSWTSLDGLVGKYPSESGLFETSVIAPDLKALLGEKFEAFRTNTGTEAPLQRDGALLYASGNKPHQGGLNQAYLIIDPAAKRLEVGLWENGKLSTFATPGAPLPRPKDVATMIRNSESAPGN